MSKQELKDAGKGLGQAFKTFGKTFVRSAERVADKVNNKDEKEGTPESTVFSDGSWKQVGREFGSALKNAGDAAANSLSRKSSNDDNVVDGEAVDVTDEQ